MKKTFVALCFSLGLTVNLQAQKLELVKVINAEPNSDELMYEHLPNGVVIRTYPKGKGKSVLTTGKVTAKFTKGYDNDLVQTHIILADGTVGRLNKFVGAGGLIKDSIFYCAYVEDDYLKYIEFNVRQSKIITEQKSSVKAKELAGEARKGVAVTSCIVANTYDVHDGKVYFRFKLNLIAALNMANVSTFGAYIITPMFFNIGKINEAKPIIPAFPELDDKKTIEYGGKMGIGVHNEGGPYTYIKNIDTEGRWNSLYCLDGYYYCRKRLTFKNKDTNKRDSSFFVVAKFDTAGKLINTIYLSASPISNGSELEITDGSYIHFDRWNKCFYTYGEVMNGKKSYSFIFRRFDLEGNLIWWFERPLDKLNTDIYKFYDYYNDQFSYMSAILLLEMYRGDPNHIEIEVTPSKGKGKVRWVYDATIGKEIDTYSHDEGNHYWRYNRSLYNTELNTTIENLLATDKSLKKQSNRFFADRCIELTDGNVYYTCPTKEDKLKLFRYVKE